MSTDVNACAKGEMSTREGLTGAAPHARPALRLHPRRGLPTVGESSAGGPLLWPAHEPWPMCEDVHEAVGHEQVAPHEPAVMASVLQIYRRDLPTGMLPDPAWSFPNGSDLLQVLWCPNPHSDHYAPRVRVYWRDRSQIRAVRDANPALTLSSEERGGDSLTPRCCQIHPEAVVEYPPITFAHPDDYDGDEELAAHLWGILPPHIESACLTWSVDGSLRGDDNHDYSKYASVPGWKLGGWSRYTSTYPRPAEHCACGAPTFLLLNTTFEGLEGPWRPTGEPGFAWADPHDDDWNGHRPTGIWGGRHGELWLTACTADSSHPIIADVE